MGSQDILEGMEYSSYRRSLSQALVRLGERDPRLVVVDPDTRKSTGAAAFAERFPDRFFTVGISEQDLLGTAAGLAIAGLKPLAIGFAMFLMRGWEIIRNTIARDRLNVKIIGTHSGLSDHMDGSSHQCLEDIALTRVLPGFTVVSPGDPAAIEPLLEQLLETEGPAYVRLGRDNALGRVHEDPTRLRLGRIEPVLEPGEVLIASHGSMLPIARSVAEELSRSGIGAGLVDVHTIKPLDIEGLSRFSRGVRLLVSIEDHNIIGGLGSALAEWLSQPGYPTHLRLLRLGVGDRFGASSRSYMGLLEHLGLTPSQLASQIRRVYEEVLARDRR